MNHPPDKGGLKIMGCGNEINDWDDKAIYDSLAGQNAELDPKVLREAMPGVRAILAERFVACLRENAEHARKELADSLPQQEQQPPLVQLGLKLEPTQREYGEMFKVGQQIGIQPYEIVNMPTVIALKDQNTLERLENTQNLIQDTISAIHNSKLAQGFKDIEAVDSVVFIDKYVSSERGKYTAGSALKEEYLKDYPQTFRNIHIFKDSKGEFPTGKEAHHTVVHELCHLNFHKTTPLGDPGPFQSIFIDHIEQWEKVCEAQLHGPGSVTEYAMGNHDPLDPEAVFHDQEFIAEHVACWDAGTGENPICSEMNTFFETYLTDSLL